MLAVLQSLKIIMVAATSAVDKLLTGLGQFVEEVPAVVHFTRTRLTGQGANTGPGTVLHGDVVVAVAFAAPVDEFLAHF